MSQTPPYLELDLLFLKHFNGLIDDSLGAFEIMPGWAPLIWEVGQAVGQHQGEAPGRPIHLVQVREKLGTLRIRLSGYTPELLDLVEKLEDRSATLCMYCGSSGQLELGIEALTACPVCRALRLDPRPAAVSELRQRIDHQINRFLNHQAELVASRTKSDD
ncbi:MAG: hypothetical protein ACPG1C_08565 [Alphaproteobacteria bacterium]